MLDLNHGLSALVDELERPVLDVLLHVTVVIFTPDEPLRVEDGVDGILRGLILRRVSDETFFFCEGDPRWCDTVSLIVGDNLDLSATLNA